jgi:predicted DNA-binding transcriptional regulator AlpA
MSTPQLIDAKNLAALLGVSEGWVKRHVREAVTEEVIPHYRIGKAIRFAPDSPEFKQWLERQKAN